jgi:thymidylate kinase
MRGFFVVCIGPDGVGKSTICGNVVEQCKGSFGSSWRFHWRPGLLPKLSRAHDDAAVTADPPLASKYTGMVSLGRFIYYWLDFVAGYWLVVYPKIARTTLVVGERYFPDVLVQPERYGFAVPRWLMRAAARGVPKPDLIVLLKDEPDVIHGRKPELSPARIGALLDAYEAEMTHWGNARVLTTEGGAAAVAERLAALILEARAARTARQIGWIG